MSHAVQPPPAPPLEFSRREARLWLWFVVCIVCMTVLAFSNRTPWGQRLAPEPSRPAVAPGIATADELATGVGSETQAGSLRIAVLSDLNASYGSRHYGAPVHAATRALVERIRPELVLITGDMVAGQRRGLDYPAMWRAFHTAVTEPLLDAGIPVLPTPGNHDAAPGAAFAGERSEYAAQWQAAERMPRVSFIDGAHYPFHYSFEHAGVFFASIDAAAVGPLSERQRQWLELQLTTSRATTKIVFGHLPIYPVAIQREAETLRDPELAEILEKHTVTAYISGHHHAYYPGAVDGIRHVAMPCLGSGARRLIGETRPSSQGLLIVEVEEGELHALYALRGPHFDRQIARHTLPPRIQHGSLEILRDDLAGLAP